jgi:hypothetical protein
MQPYQRITHYREGQTAFGGTARFPAPGCWKIARATLVFPGPDPASARDPPISESFGILCWRRVICYVQANRESLTDAGSVGP